MCVCVCILGSFCYVFFLIRQYLLDYISYFKEHIFSQMYGSLVLSHAEEDDI